MSEYITHTLFADDCRRMALAFGYGGPVIGAAFRTQADLVRLGAGSSAGDDATLAMARTAKIAGGARAEATLAFLLGWRSHNCADRQFKWIYRLTDYHYLLTPERDGPSLTAILQDAFLWREFERDGAPVPWPSGVFGPSAAKSGLPALGTLIAPTHAGSLATLFGGSAKQAMERAESFYVDAARYDEVWARPDADIAQEIERHRLYDRTDDLIVIAKRLRRGEAPGAALEPALAAADAQSHYARALRRHHDDVLSLEAFLDGRIDEDALQNRMQLEEPHVPRSIYGSLRDDEERKALLAEWHEKGGVR